MLQNAFTRSKSIRRSILALAACTTIVSTAQLRAATWPVYDLNAGARGAANRQMFQGYMDGSPNSTFVTGLHEGIDILADGQGGQEVAIIRAGTIIQKSAGNGGTLVIRVNVGTALAPVYESDFYLHTTLLAALAADGAVTEGQKIGNISTTAYRAGSRHMHYSVASGTTNLDGTATPAGITCAAISRTVLLNPFARFTADADRDPGGARPALTDTNDDKKTILINRAGKTNPADLTDKTKWETLTKTIDGDVDVIADVVDSMNSSMLTGSGPHTVGYWVEGIFDKNVEKHDVRSKADPYVLTKYDDSFAADANASSKFSSIYADDGTEGTIDNGKVSAQLRVKVNPTNFAEVKQYIVTNTKSTTGAVNKIDNDQYWRTKAKLDATIADVSDTANMATKAQATTNAEARFKDGDYIPHIFAKDLVGPAQDLTAGKVRVNNFTQTAVPGLNNGVDVPFDNTNIPFSLTDSTAPFLKGHELTDAQVASLSLTALIGDKVTVSGEEYYPNLGMYTYILPHATAGWTDGAPLIGFVAITYVLSDADGFVPFTNVWKANALGDFDMVIDYDRDGFFSATLDGLGGVTVVPEPTAVLSIVAMGGIAVMKRRVRR